MSEANGKRSRSEADLSSDDSLISLSKAEIQEIVKAAVSEALAERDTQMLSIRANMDLIMDEVDSLKDTCTNLKAMVEGKEKEIKELTDTISYLKEERVETTRKVDECENFQRRGNVRITGLPEKKGEDPLKAAQKFLHARAFNVPLEKIHSAHRIGRSYSGKPRPLLVRFLDHKTRDDVIKDRRKLKGSGRTISEDVSQLTMKTLMRVQRSDGIKNAWVWNGKVFAIHQDDSNSVFSVRPFQSIQEARNGKR